MTSLTRAQLVRACSMSTAEDRGTFGSAARLLDHALRTDAEAERFGGMQAVRYAREARQRCVSILARMEKP